MWIPRVPHYSVLKRGIMRQLADITDIPSSTFWYIGSPSHTNPILSLSNNQKSGTMYGNSRFDINSHGDMLIFNARVEDEATYTVVYFRRGGNHQQENITVEITVHPNQQCPEIAGCTSCSNCDLKINHTGELACSVSGSRPKLSLQWELRHIDYLQFTSHESQSEKDDVTGTWNSKISAEYSFSKCGAFADIRCRVQDNPKLIEQAFSDITLSADSCPTNNPGNDPPATKTFLRPKVIMLVVVCLVLILMVCFILVVMTIKMKRKKHGRQLQNIEEDETGQKLMPKASRQVRVKDGPNQQADHKIINNDNKKLTKVASLLSESYKQHCYITLVAGKEVKEVNIDTLFVESQCIVKWKNGSYQMMTTDELMTHEEILSKKSIILTGDIGFGKTTFFRQMMNKWTQQKEKTYLLIYIQLNEYNYQKNIIDILMDEIPSSYRKDVESILLNESVVALIDGLSELSEPKDCNDIATHYSELLNRIFSVHMLTARKSKKARKENIDGDPAPEELQPINDTASEKPDDIRTRNKEMRTWIALRQTKISFSQMPVTIELVGFNEEQTNKLETKMHNYRHQYDNHKANNQEKDCSTATIFETDNNEVEEEVQSSSKPFSNMHTTFNADNSSIDQKASKNSSKEEKLSLDTSVRVADNTDKCDVEKERGSLLKYMYMIKDFPNVPLFFTTLSYNHDFESRGEIAELPRAMPKIVQTLIDCMEQYYNRKQHDTTEETTNLSLRRKIDSDFLERLSKNISKSVTELETILEKDKIERAVATGLLRRASNGKSDSVSFRYPFLERLFCEYHLLKEFERGNFFLDYETLQSDYFRLPFMQVCGLQENDKSKALKNLLEKGMWDDFIDCFTALKIPETRKTQIERIKKSKEITVTNLDDIYHQDNLAAFLLESERLNYFDGTFILDGQFRVAFLTKLRLSNFVRIVFSNVKIEENDISFIVEWILKTISSPSSKHKTRTFQFHNCSINQNTVEQALQRQSVSSEVYIEITSGPSWKKWETMTSCGLGAES